MRCLGVHSNRGSSEKPTSRGGAMSDESLTVLVVEDDFIVAEVVELAL